MRSLLRVFAPSVALVLAAGAVGVACFDRFDPDPLFLRDGGFQLGDAFIPIDSTQPDSAQDSAPDAPAPTGKIQGTVYDLFMGDRGVVAGAIVSVAGRPPVTTDAEGHFAIDGVPVGDRVLVDVLRATPAGATYALSSTQVPVKVRASAVTYAMPRLQEGCIARAQVPPPDAGVFPALDCWRGSSFASLAIAADAIARANDTAFTGTLRAEIVPTTYPLDANRMPDLGALRGVPGDGAAVRADMSLAVLDTLGAAEIRLYDDATGEPLKIAQGKTATLQIAPYRQPATGETFLAWSYDAARGLWVEGTGGTMTIARTDQRVLQTTIARTGWWGVDVPRAVGCVKGTLTLGGQPVAGAVGASGVGYGQGTVPSSTASDGTWCKDVRPSASVNVSAEYFTLPAFDTYAATMTVATGAQQHSCFVDPASCTDVGALALRPRDPGCMKGKLRRLAQTDASPTPTPITTPIRVYADLTLSMDQITSGWNPRAYVGSVTPASDGSFCIEMPAAFTYEVVDTGGAACGSSPPGGAYGRPLSDVLLSGTFCDAQGDAGSACTDLGFVDIACFGPGVGN